MRDSTSQVEKRGPGKPVARHSHYQECCPGRPAARPPGRPAARPPGRPAAPADQPMGSATMSWNRSKDSFTVLC